MGSLNALISLIFGNNRNVIKETAEVFMENAEGASSREVALRAAAMEEFSKEFAVVRSGGFDRFIDGLNRVPRPLMAFGTIGLCVSAMVDPIWFSARMQGIALVPEPLWWLMGAIVSFYFGARYQVKSQDFQNSIATTLEQTSAVAANLRQLKAFEALEAGAEATGGMGTGQLPYAVGPTPVQREENTLAVPGFSEKNSALNAWRANHDE